MNKELFVTSTPHETKVGLVEDDQLAEIYLEREGEYTLAGSIYKGRVTRVLPGMQSAFVDIGLERDAFLYVSDFLELEDAGDGDEETVPVRPMPADGEVGEESVEGFAAEGGEARPQRSGSGESRRDRGYGGRSSRGGRRRGGRRDSGSRSGAGASGFGASTAMEPRDTEPSTPAARSRDFEEVSEGTLSDATRTIEFPEPRSADPHDSEFRSSESRRPESRRSEGGRSGSRFSESRQGSRGSRSRGFGSRDSGRDSSSRDSSFRDSPSRESGGNDFGPPPGYQPIVLPGESLSKYRNRPGAAVPPLTFPPLTRAEEPTSLSRRFPDDEPEFAVSAASEEVASNNLEVEQPRTQASVRSLATAAYTQPSAVYEVEEEEEEPDYPAEETDEEEVDEDIDEDTVEDIVETEDEPGADAEVLAAIPAVPSEAPARHEPELHSRGQQEYVTEAIEEEDESDDHGFEGTDAAQKAESRDSFPRDSSLTRDSGRRSAISSEAVPSGEDGASQREDSSTLAPLSFYSGSSAGVVEEE